MSIRRDEEGFELRGPTAKGRPSAARRRSRLASPRWRFSRNRSDLPPRLTSILEKPLLLKSERADEFFALELPLYREVAEVELAAGVVLPTIEQAQPSFSLTIEGSLQRLSANLRCSYGERPSLPPASDPQNRFVLRDPNGNGRLLVRNLAAEKKAVERLERAGFTPARRWL